LMPLSFLPKKAEAQNISGYVGGIAPMVASLPQCKEVINSGIENLFNGIESLFSSDPSSNDIINKQQFNIDNPGMSAMQMINLTDIANSAANQVTGIETYNPTSAKNEEEIKARLKKIEGSTESLNTNSTCIQSIGRLIIKMLLQKLTVSTVKWINNGFDGSPAFIQDPGKFFGDIAKNEILQFGIEINNPELFPFGRAWMQNTAIAFNNKFQDNAQYSLNRLIKETTPEYSAITFQEDFSQGGWNAWTALTQVPANNPLGFKLMADNEIQRRLAGTTQSTAEAVHEALSQANGFLGDMRCSNPTDVTKAEQERYNNGEEGARNCDGGFEYVTPGKMISDKATEVLGYQNNAYLNVEDLNDAVAAILDALLAQFSSNIMEKGFANFPDQGADGSLIYDSSFINESYTTQTEKDFIPSHLTSSWLQANRNFNIRTDLTQALIDEQRTYSDKLTLQNQELMSTTDGKPYAIDAIDYTLPDGTKTKISNAYGLIPTIYQLDYCIPGPHPGWENDSRGILAAATEQILPETKESLENLDPTQVVEIVKAILPEVAAASGFALAATGGALATTFLFAGSFAGPLGAIAGLAVGYLISFFIDLFSGSDEGLNIRTYYSLIIAGFTGTPPDFKNKTDARVINISSKQGTVQGLNTILNRYIEIMNKTYFSSKDILPSVTKEAAITFNQLNGYGQIIKKNEEKILLLKTMIDTLGKIKESVNELNTEYKNEEGQFKADLSPNDPEYSSSLTETNYENDLKTQINELGRLSMSMVNGDDIASADNLYKQIIDKKEYIYKNLLKGPYGCEADLMKPQKKFPSAQINHELEEIGKKDLDWDNFDVNSVQRMTYPFPIIYDYNHFVKGENIPDPWNSGYDTPNKIPDADVNNTLPYSLYYDNNKYYYGPGFLSFVYFSSGYVQDSGLNYTEVRGSQRLQIHDIFGMGTDSQFRYTAVGNRHKFGNDDGKGGPWETIIGVY